MKTQFFLIAAVLCILTKTSAQIRTEQDFQAHQNSLASSCFNSLDAALLDQAHGFTFTNPSSARSLQITEGSHILKSYETYEFSSVSDSIPTIKSEYTTTESGDEINLELFIWDEEKGDWHAWRKWIHLYDAQGRERYIYMYTFDRELDRWERTMMDSIADEQSEIKVTYRFQWNEDELSWKLTHRMEIEDNESENYMASAMYEFDYETNQWVGCCKNESAFNNDGNVVLSTQYVWNSDTEDWIQWAKNEIDYDTDGRQISDMRYEWNNDDMSWEYVWKSIYSYDAENNETKDTYEWDVSLKDWVWTEVEEITYNDVGNMILRDNTIIPYIVIG